MTEMFILVGVNVKNKKEWNKVKSIVSNSLYENQINYMMVDQDFGMKPKTFDYELKKR